MSLIEYVGSIGGIAGVLALLIFLAYKYLVNQMRQDRVFMEDRLTNIIKDYNQICKEHTDAVINQTKVQTELVTWLKAKNGNH